MSRTTSLKKYRILDVGCGPDGGTAKDAFKDYPGEKEIVTLDGNPENNPDIVHNITQPFPEEIRNAFDVVYVSHVLEHIDRDKVVNTMRYIFSAVKNLGEVWLIVPSMEWAANRIIHHDNSVAMQLLIFGGQKNEWDYHRNGFTLQALRFMGELCGMVTRRAYQSPFLIGMDDKKYQCIQNIWIGMRYDSDETGVAQRPKEGV